MVVIIGGGFGIGCVFVCCFGEEGVCFVFVDVNEVELVEVFVELSGVGCDVVIKVCDVSDFV